MRVVVIGVTGRIGKRVAKLLHQNGHEVVGLNRRAERVHIVFAGQPPFATHAVDALDAAAMASHLATADAIVFATAPTREAPDEWLTQNLNALAAAASGTRLVALSGSYALTAPGGRPMLEASPPNPYFLELESVFSKQVAAYRAHAATAPVDSANGISAFDWLLIAPPPETYPYGETTGDYRLAENQMVVTDPTSLNFKETSKISMEDLAHFIVAQIEQPTLHETLVSIAY